MATESEMRDAVVAAALDYAAQRRKIRDMVPVPPQPYAEQMHVIRLAEKALLAAADALADAGAED